MVFVYLLFDTRYIRLTDFFGLRELLQERDTKYKTESKLWRKGRMGKQGESFQVAPYGNRALTWVNNSLHVCIFQSHFYSNWIFCKLLACHIIWALLTFKDDPIFSGEHGGASLPKAAELWLCRRLAGAPHWWAAQNSLSNTSYRRAPSQSPAPAHFRAVQLLKLNNIPQVSLPRKPPYTFTTFFAVTKSASHVVQPPLTPLHMLWIQWKLHCQRHCICITCVSKYLAILVKIK